MEKLEFSAPAAYANLSTIEDTAIRSRFAEAVHTLVHHSHIDEQIHTDPENPFYETRERNRISPEAFDDSQIEHHERVSQLLEDASELLAVSVKEAEGTELDPWQLAMQASFEQALGSKSQNNPENTTRALETFCTLSLLDGAVDSKSGERYTSEIVREAVASNLSNELLHTLNGMNGIVSLRDGEVFSLGQAIGEDSSTLLQIATRKGCDYQFQHIINLGHQDLIIDGKIDELKDPQSMLTLVRHFQASGDAYRSEVVVGRLARTELAPDNAENEDLANLLASTPAKILRDPGLSSLVPEAILRGGENPQIHKLLVTMIETDDFDGKNIPTETADRLQALCNPKLQEYAIHGRYKSASYEIAAKILAGIGNQTEQIDQLMSIDEALGSIEDQDIELQGIGNHTEQWLELAQTILNKQNPNTLKRQIAKRLRLGIGEDQVAAIRMFTEIMPNREDLEALKIKQLQLISLFQGADEVRGFPSAKPTKLSGVFIDSELSQLYQEAYRQKQTGTAEPLQGFEEDNIPAYEGELRELLASLRSQTAQYQNDARVAERWLEEYSGQPIIANKLISAWQARHFAVTEHGINDAPKDILDFIKEAGTEQYLKQAISKGSTHLTEAEVESYRSYWVETAKRYDPHRTQRAIEEIAKYHREHGQYPEKILKSTSENIDAQGLQYRAEIIDGGDPRAFTIGYDTGCCMTLGGASESCIWAGVEDPRYSFFAVYDSNNRLRAQSLLYIAEQPEGKILVVDNIETNQGTDKSKLVDVYEKALTNAIQAQSLDIAAIHIGEGYTDQELLEGMPAVEHPARGPLSIYTDARTQRRLWSRSD